MNVEEKIKETFSWYEYLSHEHAYGFNFDLIHIRDSGEFAYQKGYCDAKIIYVELYNTRTYKAIKLNNFIDEINLSEADVLITRIFLDGSTVIKFKREHVLASVTQTLYARAL